MEFGGKEGPGPGEYDPYRYVVFYILNIFHSWSFYYLIICPFHFLQWKYFSIHKFDYW